VVRHRARRALAATAAVLGLLAAVPGARTVDTAAVADEIERGSGHVTAVELATWIRERRAGLRVLDLRDELAYEAYHVPSAERATPAEVARLRPRAGEALVLYGDGGARAAQAWALLRAAGVRDVYFLRGGLLDWTEDVMNPIVGADSASARVAALSRYFGGVPRDGASAAPAADVSRDAAAAVLRIRRRGC
jgi:rhodanese-related sulfurtransferase